MDAAGFTECVCVGSTATERAPTKRGRRGAFHPRGGLLHAAASPPARGMRRLPRAGADAPSEGANEVARSGATARDGADPGRISADVEKAAALWKVVGGGGHARVSCHCPRRRVSLRRAALAGRAHRTATLEIAIRARAMMLRELPHVPVPRPDATHLPAGHPEQQRCG